MKESVRFLFSFFVSGSCSTTMAHWHRLYWDLLIVLVMLHVKQMGQNGGNSTVLVCLT